MYASRHCQSVSRGSPGRGSGSGSVRYMNGSNLDDSKPHSAQRTVDLSWPWNWSTTTLRSRCR
eukprot:scaffold11166_cov58-Phaeocystis_antarctica.AAC.1